MSLEAITFARTLPVSDPLSVILLWVIGENTPNATGVCGLTLEQLAREAKTTRRKAGDRLKKLIRPPAPALAIDPETGAIELVGFRRFRDGFAADVAEATAARTVSAPVPIRGRHDLLIEELRRSGCASNVLRLYLMKVSNLITIAPKDPRALFVEVCTKLADWPDRALTLLADHTIDHRSKLSTIKQVNEDVKAILPRAQIKITPLHPGWPAWLAHFRGTGKANHADFLERQGCLFSLTEYPPGHWGGKAEQSEGRAA